MIKLPKVKKGPYLSKKLVSGSIDNTKFGKKYDEKNREEK